MTAKRARSDGPSGLRREAEKNALAGEAKGRETLTPAQTQHALHELRVHQIELEMQNEELRRAQVDLDTARARYFDLYDMAPVGYFAISESGIILEANLTAANMLGVARDALVNYPMVPFVLKEDQDIYYLYCKQTTETCVPHACELRLVRGNGTEFWAHLTATVGPTPESLPNGIPAVRRVVMIDISERKRSEAEKTKLEDRLRQSQKMESVGRLAGGVAHDFNNMLHVIIGCSELALPQTDSGSQVFECLTQIQKAAQRSADLTRQLLGFARKQPISPKRLDLDDAVASMLKMLGRLIGEDIDLVWRPGKNAHPVMIDPSQLDQILANLAVNARDAITGVGTITIETSSVNIGDDDSTELVPGEYVLLSVSDDGCGMNRDTVANLFEPFFTTKELGRGTGLGLATIYGVVRQNNGYINVYSEPGYGTTFRIHFPRCESDPLEVPAAGVQSKPPTGTETVLLVEDEETLLTIVRQFLERLGYTVLATGNPIDALQMVEKHAGNFDLLVTDVVMPDMSGRELWRNIAARWPKAKCLYISGYPSGVIARQGIMEDGVNFLQKPFTISALAEKIREALGDEPEHKP
ncbi:MAG: ATP-binding protein [Candidatus Brocadiia bacterium]